MIEVPEAALSVSIAVVPQGWLCVFPSLRLQPFSTIKYNLHSYAYTSVTTQALHVVAGVFAYCHKNSCQVDHKL
jgi:hypothetical protein